MLCKAGFLVTYLNLDNNYDVIFFVFRLTILDITAFMMYLLFYYSQNSNMLNSSRLKVLKAREDHINVSFFFTFVSQFV